VTFDDVEHCPLPMLARNHDMGRPIGSRQGERRCQLVEAHGGKIDGIGLETQPRAGGEEALLIQAIAGQRREAAHIGLADRPADLLGHVEQRPHQRIDGTHAVRAIVAEPAIFQRSHSPSAPAALLPPPVRLPEIDAKSND
jgi:hypothetical protein